MKNLTATAALALLMMLSAPALADDKDKTPSVVGSWLLTEITVNGEQEKDKDIGKAKMVFGKDGTVTSYNEGKLDRKGWYEMKEGRLYLYEDKNKNGKLDEEEKEDAEHFKPTVEGDILSLENELEFGDKKIKIVAKLKRVD